MQDLNSCVVNNTEIKFVFNHVDAILAGSSAVLLSITGHSFSEDIFFLRIFVVKFYLEKFMTNTTSMQSINPHFKQILLKKNYAHLLNSFKVEKI